MKRNRMLGAVVLGFAAALGCSDKKSSGQSAVQACETFATTWCDKAVGCIVANGMLTQSDFRVNVDTCIDVAAATARCKNAVSLAPDFDNCLDEIDALTCSNWNVPVAQVGTITPPLTCVGAVMVHE